MGVIIPEFDLLVTIVRCHHHHRLLLMLLLPRVVRGRHLHRLLVAACCNVKEDEKEEGETCVRLMQNEFRRVIIKHCPLLPR